MRHAIHNLQAKAQPTKEQLKPKPKNLEPQALAGKNSKTYLAQPVRVYLNPKEFTFLWTYINI